MAKRQGKYDEVLQGVPMLALVDAIKAEHERTGLALLRATTMLNLVSQAIERGDIDGLQRALPAIKEAAQPA